MSQCKVQHQHPRQPYPPETDRGTVWYCMKDTGHGHGDLHKFDCGCRAPSLRGSFGYAKSTFSNREGEK